MDYLVWVPDEVMSDDCDELLGLKKKKHLYLSSLVNCLD